MASGWSRLKKFSRFDEERDLVPEKSGVYIVKRRAPIGRLGGRDEAGIIYIGKSVDLHRRLLWFMSGNHIASWFLWKKVGVARKIFGKKYKNNDDWDKMVGHLEFRYCLLRKNQLNNRERAVIYAYVKKYGEVPPLNFSFPKRMKEAPKDNELKWARGALR